MRRQSLAFRRGSSCPRSRGETKIALVRGTGADLEVVPGHYGQAAAAAEAARQASGAITIHAYDAPETLAGQGTVGTEFEEQAPDLDILLVAVGGGGLIGGIASWYDGRIRVVAVEPEEAPTLAVALRDGPEAEITPSGVAANSLGGPMIGRLAYDVVTRLGIDCVLVPDAAITDEFAYNRNVAHRPAEVADVMLDCRVQINEQAPGAPGTLLLSGTDFRETFEVQITPGRGEVCLRQNERIVRRAKLDGWQFAEPTRLELSLFDRCVLLAVDGHVVLDYPYAPSNRPRRPTSRFSTVARGRASESRP